MSHNALYINRKFGRSTDCVTSELTVVKEITERERGKQIRDYRNDYNLEFIHLFRQWIDDKILYWCPVRFNLLGFHQTRVNLLHLALEKLQLLYRKKRKEIKKMVSFSYHKTVLEHTIVLWFKPCTFNSSTTDSIALQKNETKVTKCPHGAFTLLAFVNVTSKSNRWTSRCGCDIYKRYHTYPEVWTNITGNKRRDMALNSFEYCVIRSYHSQKEKEQKSHWRW